jgi:hypothetical protein
LIYLCEKRVVIPDLGEARGRGSSRLFSPRNLLEFEIALKLRELTVPVGSIAAILYALRVFEKKVERRIPGFRLPDGLKAGGAPDLRAIVTDAGRLYFSIGPEGGDGKLYGGIDFGRVTAASRSKRRSRTKGAGPSLDLPALDGRRLAHDAKARVEVSVTRIARGLDLGR